MEQNDGEQTSPDHVYGTEPPQQDQDAICSASSHVARSLQRERPSRGDVRGAGQRPRPSAALGNGGALCAS